MEGYYKNKEDHIKWVRTYQKNNIDHHQAYQRQYLRNNKDRLKTYGEKYKSHRHIIYKKEWIACKDYFDNKCAYCGLPIDQHFYTRKGFTKLGDFHKDHVIHNGKNDLRNCVPSCSSCNEEKHRKTLNEFYNKNNQNYAYERYYKIYMWLRYDYKKFILPKKRYKSQTLKSRLKEIEKSKLGIV